MPLDNLAIHHFVCVFVLSLTIRKSTTAKTGGNHSERRQVVLSIFGKLPARRVSRGFSWRLQPKMSNTAWVLPSPLGQPANRRSKTTFPNSTKNHYAFVAVVRENRLYQYGKKCWRKMMRCSAIFAIIIGQKYRWVPSIFVSDRNHVTHRNRGFYSVVLILTHDKKEVL